MQVRGGMRHAQGGEPGRMAGKPEGGRGQATGEGIWRAAPRSSSPVQDVVPSESALRRSASAGERPPQLPKRCTCTDEQPPDAGAPLPRVPKARKCMDGGRRGAVGGPPRAPNHRKCMDFSPAAAEVPAQIHALSGFWRTKLAGTRTSLMRTAFSKPNGEEKTSEQGGRYARERRCPDHLRSVSAHEQGRSGAGVGLGVLVFDVLEGEVGIDLRGRETGVPEELLDAAQVGTT